jgi:biotin carboxyl carrier protein
LADHTPLLRDGAGVEHRAKVLAADRVVVNDVELTVKAAADGSLHINGPRNVVAWAIATGETTWVFLDGQVFTFEPAKVSRTRAGGGHHASLTAPMPSTVRKVNVKPGDTVRRGDVLIVLEAMKMELPVRADTDGVVGAVRCREGEMVQPGQELVEVD